MLIAKGGCCQLHYLLVGGAEPGPELRSQAVLGGKKLGDDPEGLLRLMARRATFARLQVRELSEELCGTEVIRCPSVDRPITGVIDCSGDEVLNQVRRSA